MELTTIIALVSYLILVLGLGIGFLFGLRRGLVRSSIRLGILLVFLIVGGLITIPISSAISNIDISSYGWEVGGETISTLPEGIKALLLQNEQINQAANEMPSVLKLVESLPTAIISIVVFMLLVIVMSLLSWIVYIIIERFALKSSRLERKMKKQIKQDKKNLKGKQLIPPSSVQIVAQKENRRRWLGSAVGTVTAFILLFCLFIPISSLTSTVSEIASSPSLTVSAEKNSNNHELLTETSSDLLKYYAGEEVVSYINAYSQSVPGKILTLGGFDDVIFDSITSISVNNEQFSFRSDILNICKAYDDCVLLIDEIGLSENYKNVDFEKIEAILNKFLDLGIFKVLADEAVPYALTYLYDSEFFGNLDYNFQIKTAIDNVVNSLKNSSKGLAKTLKEDVSYILKICKSACEVGLVDSLVGGDRDLNTFVNYLTFENNKLLNSITENITSSYTLKSVLTNGINVGFEIVYDKTDNELYLGKLDQNKIDWSATNNSINSFIKNAIDCYNLLNKYDFDKVVSNFKIVFSDDFEASDFDSLITLLSKELQLLKSSPLIVGQEVNAYNQLVDYAVMQDNLNNLLDASLLKEINIEEEIELLKSSILILKQRGIIDYALNNKIDIDEFCLLFVNKESLENKTYVPEILKPFLNSRLSQKPIKYCLSLINENLDYLKEKIGQEINEIDLSNFTYLSASDKEEILNVIKNTVILVKNIGLESFANNTISTILTLNDPSSTGVINSQYVVDILVPLSNISILNSTYNSIFIEAGNNEKLNKYFTLESVTNSDFSWEQEFEIVNNILTVLEKENNETSIINLIFPNDKFEKVEITNELISKIFNNLKLPLYETMPETSSIRVLVNNLYDSKIIKQLLVYLINTLNESVSNIISTEDNSISISNINLNNLTNDQEEDIVLVLENLANAFDIFIKEDFDLGSLTDNEVEKIGKFLNSLKENAYDYENGKPNSNCYLSENGKTVVNGGIFAELYIAMIDYAKQTYSFSGTISYGEIEWINFLKTAKKLTNLSQNNENILDIIANPDSDVNVGEALEVIGVSKDTSNKIENIQSSFTDLDSSSQSFDNLSSALDNITEENTNEIINVVENATGAEISSSIDFSMIKNEQIVSNRISLLITNGLNNENLDESLSDLCNGATYVLQNAVAKGVVINYDINGGFESLSIQIDSKTTNETIRNLVKSLFSK